MIKCVSDSVIMLIFGRTKVVKETFYGGKKASIWDVDINNIVISNLIKTIIASSKYLIRYVNEVIKPLVLILPEMKTLN